MKILIVHNHYVHPGGEDSVVESEVRMLKGYGHDVYVYKRSNQELRNQTPLQKMRSLLKDVYFSNKTYQQIREIIKEFKPDVVHVHNTFLTISSSVFAACVKEQVAVVQTLHNYRYLCPVALFYRKGDVCEKCLSKGRFSAVIHRCWKNSFLLSWVQKRIVDQYYDKGILENQISHFIALSDFSKDKHVRNGFDPHKISVKPNFLEKDPGFSKETGEYALYIGGLFPYKGVRTMLSAFENGLPLKIMGSGPLQREVEAVVNRNTNMEYLGSQSQEGVIHYLKKARCVIIPSECYENLPRVLVESFACGIPVVASHIGSLKELIIHRQTGLHFQPKDSEDLKSKVMQIFEDKELTLSMKNAARVEFEKNYTMAFNSKLLMDIYTQAIKSNTALV